MAVRRINRDEVLAAIRDRKHRGRVIWSPSTTLAAMGIEWYPHWPRDNYRRIKAVLKRLCEEGELIQRPRLHSHYTFNEVAYERAPRRGP